jgi:hypothetical protein
MENPKKITLETIREILDGQDPNSVNAQTLRTKLGRGSYSTIQKHLDYLREETAKKSLPQGMLPPTAPPVPAHIQPFITQAVWEMAWKTAYSSAWTALQTSLATAPKPLPTPQSSPTPKHWQHKLLTSESYL